MQLELNYEIENILILGAGASVDFGLPLWATLSSLIKSRIKEDAVNQYKYKKEIFDWVEKVGEGKKYKTIDECIANESKHTDYHSDGDYIENEIFLMMKDIFDDLYKENENNWIRSLNSKILNNESLEDKIAFINYNYDKVLEENFLNFEYLSGKERRLNGRERLQELSEASAPSLYPHGNLYPLIGFKHLPNILRYTKTMKSGIDEYLDAVSCYESARHTLYKSNRTSRLKIFILGLGGGLKMNLDNINISNPIDEIHVTIKDIALRTEVLEFLNKKYKVPFEEIIVYDNCDELIQKCF